MGVSRPSTARLFCDAALLDALHLMHDQKYQHLPLVDDGVVQGLVDAIDVMNATMGDGSSGTGDADADAGDTGGTHGPRTRSVTWLGESDTLNTRTSSSSPLKTSPKSLLP
jgi:hypothetical protein